MIPAAISWPRPAPSSPAANLDDISHGRSRSLVCGGDVALDRPVASSAAAAPASPPPGDLIRDAIPHGRTRSLSPLPHRGHVRDDIPHGHPRSLVHGDDVPSRRSRGLVCGCGPPFSSPSLPPRPQRHARAPRPRREPTAVRWCRAPPQPPSARGRALTLPDVGSSAAEASLRPLHGNASSVVAVARATVARPRVRGAMQCPQTYEKAT